MSYIRTPEILEKQSKALMGHLVSREVRDKIAKALIGTTRTEESKLKQSKTMSGENHPNYNPKNYIMETRYCACGCLAPFECSITSEKSCLTGHSRLTKEKHENMSRATSGKNNGHYGKPAAKEAGRGKVGTRLDLNQFFRSTWEANQARVFNWEGIPWKFESKRFYFTGDNVKSSYCPDFHIPGTNIWYEVKGYMDDVAKKTIKIFRKQYPNEILIVIGKEEYGRMRDTYKDLIPNWES
jgi:hypothetical protein